MAGCIDWVDCVQFVFYIPILAAGFPLNMAALWQLFFHVRRWNESTVYLLNLVINDCLLLLALPFKILAYGRSWTLGHFPCSMFESFVYVNMYGSILLSVCISVDRYVALHFPFQRLRSKRKAVIVCAFLWTILFGFSYPVYDLHRNSNDSFCFHNFSNHTWNKQWIIVCVECVFWGSTAIMVFCSVHVVKILNDLRKRNPNDAKLRNNKSVKIVLSNLVVFLLCFIPYHIAVLLYFHVKRNNISSEVINGLRKFVHVSLCVSSMNCLADAVCYYFILKENLQIAQQDARANTLTQDTQLSTVHTLIQRTHTYPQHTH